MQPFRALSQSVVKPPLLLVLAMQHVVIGVKSHRSSSKVLIRLQHVMHEGPVLLFCSPRYYFYLVPDDANLGNLVLMKSLRVNELRTRKDQVIIRVPRRTVHALVSGSRGLGRRAKAPTFVHESQACCVRLVVESSCQ